MLSLQEPRKRSTVTRHFLSFEGRVWGWDYIGVCVLALYVSNLLPSLFIVSACSGVDLEILPESD